MYFLVAGYLVSYGTRLVDGLVVVAPIVAEGLMLRFTSEVERLLNVERYIPRGTGVFSYKLESGLLTSKYVSEEIGTS